MSKKWLLALLMLVTVGVLGALAEPVRVSGEAGSPKMIDRLTTELGLSETQEAALKSGLTRAEQETKAIRDQNKGRFESIQQEMRQNNPDKTVIHDLIKQINEAEARSQIIRMDQMIDFRQQLTAAQKPKFDELMAPGKKWGMPKEHKKGRI